jgi:hypothetical protein
VPEANLFKIFTARLNAHGIAYFVTGAAASSLYGEPRLTLDIDLVVEMGIQDARKFREAFPLDEFYCPPVEIIQVETARSLRGHFNLIHHQTGFKADIYMTGKDELHSWAMRNRRSYMIEGEPVWFAPPEYVVLRKLEYCREGGSDKHLRDIAGILIHSRDQVDFDELQSRIVSRNLSNEWAKAKDLL